jgi:hypothetical protein
MSSSKRAGFSTTSKKHQQRKRSAYFLKSSVYSATIPKRRRDSVIDMCKSAHYSRHDSTLLRKRPGLTASESSVSALDKVSLPVETASYQLLVDSLQGADAVADKTKTKQSSSMDVKATGDNNREVKQEGSQVLVRRTSSCLPAKICQTDKDHSTTLQFDHYEDSFCSRFEDKLSEVDVRTIETFYGKGSGEWYSVHMDMMCSMGYNVYASVPLMSHALAMAGSSCGTGSGTDSNLKQGEFGVLHRLASLWTLRNPGNEEKSPLFSFTSFQREVFGIMNRYQVKATLWMCNEYSCLIEM